MNKYPSIYKKVSLGIGLLFAATLIPETAIKAQYLQDVIRVSQAEKGSTARFKALGNAQTALGGDISSLSGNPAGLGFFTRSDASISFDFLADVNDANYFDQKTAHKNHEDLANFLKALSADENDMVQTEYGYQKKINVYVKEIVIELPASCQE